MEIECGSCGGTSVLDQPYPYHSGFADQGFLYCDACPAVVTFSTWDPDFGAMRLGNPWNLRPDERSRVEAALKPCRTCGKGRFRFGLNPRCPRCNESLPGWEGSIYYLITGVHWDAEKGADIWERPVEPDPDAGDAPA